MSAPNLVRDAKVRTVRDRLAALRTKLKAPRRLQATTEGRWLLILTLVVGFAAMNTGNNLLFFGWGLLLATVLISGLLSEATLKIVRARVLRASELRVGEAGSIAIDLSNVGRRLPAFGVEVAAQIEDPDGARREAPARYHLRLEAGHSEEICAHDSPKVRGVHRLLRLSAATRYPFGFFKKSRDFAEVPPREVLVYPARVDTGAVPNRLLARLGQQATRQPGVGDEFFSLRPFREGDDVRKVHWRRSARSGRLHVKETESDASRHVVIEVVFAARRLRAEGRARHEDSGGERAQEATIAFAGSLAEDLLQQGHAVGMSAPGIALLPGRGSRQRAALLSALARLHPAAIVPPSPAGLGMARVAVLAPGATVPPGTSWSHEVSV